jgi:hypothetical protein
MAARRPLGDYPDDYLMCRFQRYHPWKLIGDRLTQVNGQLVAQWRCRQCPMTKEVVYDSRGRRKSVRYDRPKDYYIKGGVDGIDVVREVIQRHAE